ncbi:MAG: hypothetical protein ABR915_24925 [Thermoguttaceae bacterium]|jgi:hypothetical protein
MRGTVGRINRLRVRVAAGILAIAVASPLPAQQAGVLPPPPAIPPRGSSSPADSYDSLKAGQDAYQWAERERQAQIGWQAGTLSGLSGMNPRLPLRAYRPLLPDLWAYPYWAYPPYYGMVAQPTGHEKIWTGPNSYIYRPRWDLPPASAGPHPPWPARPGLPGTGRSKVPPPPPPMPPTEGDLPPTARSL